MGTVRVWHSSHGFATQSSHSVDRAGWQAKMASIIFWIPWLQAPLNANSHENSETFWDGHFHFHVWWWCGAITGQVVHLHLRHQWTAVHHHGKLDNNAWCYLGNTFAEFFNWWVAVHQVDDTKCLLLQKNRTLFLKHVPHTTSKFNYVLHQLNIARTRQTSYNVNYQNYNYAHSN